MVNFKDIFMFLLEFVYITSEFDKQQGYSSRAG